MRKQLVLLHAEYLTCDQILCYRNQFSVNGKGKKKIKNNSDKKIKPSPQKRDKSHQSTIKIVQKESQNPDQPPESHSNTRPTIKLAQPRFRQPSHLDFFIHLRLIWVAWLYKSGVQVYNEQFLRHHSPLLFSQ